METSTQEVSRTFGINLPAAAAQLLTIAWLIGAVYATVVVLRTFRGWLLLAWLLVCWLLIPIGPIIAILATRRQAALS